MSLKRRKKTIVTKHLETFDASLMLKELNDIAEFIEPNDEEITKHCVLINGTMVYYNKEIMSSKEKPIGTILLQGMW